MAQPLNMVDNAWLAMDSSTNLMMITGVLVFETPLALDALRATVERRMLRFEHFTMKLAGRDGHLCWERDPEFNIRAHLHRVALPAPAGQAELQELASDLMSTPVDMRRPLWQFHLIEDFQGGSALIARIHHTVGDGMALVQVLLSLTDDSPAPAAQLPAAPAARRPARSVVSIAADGRALIDDPAKIAAAADLAGKGALALAKLLFLPPDTPNLFRGRLGVEKRAAWSRPIALDDVKLVGRLTRGTVNDVLINAVVGALRRYLLRHGEAVDGRNIRAIVPVNLRPPDVPLTELSNKFGVIFLDLPIGIADPFDRLLEIRRRTDAIKGSPEALVAFGLLNTIGALPEPAANLAIELFASKVTAVMTNVPGPRQPIYLAGSRIRQVLFWVPQSGKLGLGVSIFSYAGEVTVGIATDTGLVPDPETIAEDFAAEFESLAALARAVA